MHGKAQDLNMSETFASFSPISQSSIIQSPYNQEHLDLYLNPSFYYDQAALSQDASQYEHNKPMPNDLLPQYNDERRVNKTSRIKPPSASFSEIAGYGYDNASDYYSGSSSSMKIAQSDAVHYDPLGFPMTPPEHTVATNAEMDTIMAEIGMWRSSNDYMNTQGRHFDDFGFHESLQYDPLSASIPSVEHIPSTGHMNTSSNQQHTHRRALDSTLSSHSSFDQQPPTVDLLQFHPPANQPFTESLLNDTSFANNQSSNELPFSGQTIAGTSSVTNTLAVNSHPQRSIIEPDRKIMISPEATHSADPIAVKQPSLSSSKRQGAAHKPSKSPKEVTRVAFANEAFPKDILHDTSIADRKTSFDDHSIPDASAVPVENTTITVLPQDQPQEVKQADKKKPNKAAPLSKEQSPSSYSFPEEEPVFQDDENDLRLTSVPQPQPPPENALNSLMCTHELMTRTVDYLKRKQCNRGRKPKYVPGRSKKQAPIIKKLERREYFCSFANCILSHVGTKCRSALASHIASSHLEVQSLTCTVCQKDFSRTDALRRHMRVVHRLLDKKSGHEDDPTGSEAIKANWNKVHSMLMASSEVSVSL